ncbi:MAG: hypothetical protein DHS20C19_26730 [Acidimicrobiales bacterium]|nr:MAG: hypothetical protein DHS20C19_26730 [Acidimicrobiales bacterium]
MNAGPLRSHLWGLRDQKVSRKHAMVVVREWDALLVIGQRTFVYEAGGHV